MSESPRSMRPRVLVLSPRYPYPVIGGDRLRLVRICEVLSERFDLTLLSLCETVEELNAAAPTDGIFSRIERVLLPRWRSYVSCAAAIVTRRPLQVAYYRSRPFFEAVQRLTPVNDVCLAHLVRTAQYALSSGLRPSALEMTDAISMNYQRVRTAGGNRGVRGRIYRFEEKRLLRYERDILARFDLTCLVSNVDRQYFEANGCDVSKVLVCPNGVALETELVATAPPLDTPAGLMVFIGNMTSLQNMDAVRSFIESVLPRLRSRLSVTLRVVGRIYDKDARSLRRIEGVEVTGEVDDVRAHCRGAFVGVCPVRIGAGIQNKILEYMSMGIPVVSSSVGLEGLSATPGCDLMVADDADSQAEAISEIAHDKELSSRLSKNGRAFVERNHDWRTVTAPIADALDRLIHARARNVEKGVEPDSADYAASKPVDASSKRVSRGV